MSTPKRMHQEQLWIRICQIVNGDPSRDWTPEALAAELGMELSGDGFCLVLEVLSNAEFAEAAERQKIKVGFV